MRRSHDLQMGSVQFNTCGYMTVVRLNELEAKLQAPTADPKHLLRLLGNISSATVDAPCDFQTSMFLMFSSRHVNGNLRTHLK